MSDPNLEPMKIATYIKAIVERYVRPIALSLTNANALLTTLSDLTRQNAENSQEALSATQLLLEDFESRYLGVLATDPSISPTPNPLVVGCIYIRSTDGRLRWLSQLTPSLIWSDANVLPFPISPGVLTIQGTGNDAGISLDNTLVNLDIRLLQKSDGSFIIKDVTNNIELMNVSATNPLFRGAVMWTSANDGSGSGLDADLLRGFGWASGQNVAFGSVSGTSFTRSGNTVWDAANDGSGSGLDADLVRGLVPLFPSSLSALTNSNGTSLRIPFGATVYLLQFGQVRTTIGDGSSNTVTFPEPFAAAPPTVLGFLYDPTNSYGQNHLANGARDANSATFRSIADDSGGIAIAGFDWVAIGLAP